MDLELKHAALHAIAFLTGAALNAMLASMQLRVDRATGRSSGYQLLWVLGFIWTFGSFLRCALELAGTSADSLGARLAESFAWSCTVLGPVATGRFLQARIGDAASRRFIAICVVMSCVNLGLLIGAAMVYDFHVDASWYPAASFFIALFVTAIALILYRLNRHALPQPRPSTPRWFTGTAALLAAIQAVATLLTMQQTWMPEGLSSAVGLFIRHWTIPWSILIAVSLAQAHYADVVLKRSLWLLASVTAATLASLYLFRIPPGLDLLAAALGTAALMLVTPWLIDAIRLLVDRILLRRPDYSQAMRQLEESLRRAGTPEQLHAVALDAARSTLHLEARLVDESAAAPAALASIPVASARGPRLRLEVTASHQARSLMHQELAFLGAIGTQLGSRLDALHFEQEQRALHLREERLKRLLTEAELKALRTQVDPHFLFNTLNTILDLIGSNPAQAEKMTERLAECFRYALSKHSRDLSTLDEELEFARHYLEIEQVRFGDRLRVELSRGDASGNESIPSLLLQPLLENAIRHGLAPMREGGRVSVHAQRDGDNLRLQVEDDGAGLRADFGAGTGIGLRNVQERLQTLYAQAAQFLIGGRQSGRGTSVTIVVPLHGN